MQERAARKFHGGPLQVNIIPISAPVKGAETQASIDDQCMTLSPAKFSSPAN
jgi:hypothetical protein